MKVAPYRRFNFSNISAHLRQTPNSFSIKNLRESAKVFINVYTKVPSKRHTIRKT